MSLTDLDKTVHTWHHGQCVSATGNMHNLDTQVISYLKKHDHKWGWGQCKGKI